MCGIFGFIGASKNPKVTYDLLNKLFIRTEIRGTDASGFYAYNIGNGAIMYDKEPKKSSEYTKQDVWTKTALSFVESGVNLFIGHCRQTSVGGGPERINRNNHPHVSKDYRIAMVHNGKIPEFSALRSRYNIESDCDSELLLRMFESSSILAKDKEQLKIEFPNLSPFTAMRMLGLKDIFSRVNYGAMAVAIAERGDDNSRYLWLFRDEERPLCVIDMRDTLGHIFFCSTPEIWRQVVEDTPSAKEYVPADQSIYEFPANEIWLLSLPQVEQPFEDLPVENTWNVQKFKVTKTKLIDHHSEQDDDKLNFKQSGGCEPPMKVESRLDKDEAIISSTFEAPTDSKKKLDDGSAGKTSNAGPPANQLDGLNSIQTSAKVVIPFKDDATGTELSNGDNIVITGEEILRTSLVTVKDVFTMVKSVETELSILKREIDKQVTENTIQNHDYSIIMDQVISIRNEIETFQFSSSV